MKKILSIFCLLCLFAAPLALTACESPEEEAAEEAAEGEATVETTFEEGAIEVDETVGTELDMGTDMDTGTDVDDFDDVDEPPAE
jgi:hypothetical protein